MNELAKMWKNNITCTRASIHKNYGLSPDLQRKIELGMTVSPLTISRAARALNIENEDAMRAYENIDFFSHSQIRTYKTCLKKYEFAYIHRLVPIEDAEALKTGTSYHAKIASLLKNGTFDPTGEKTDAMASAFKKYILPQLPEVSEVESKTLGKVGRMPFIAYLDALGSDNIPIEHKTTSSDIDDEYKNNLMWDDQVTIYCILKGIRKVRYTAIKKPTIRQKQNENEMDFAVRCAEWYDEDTEHKIGTFLVTRTQAEIDDKVKEIEQVCREIETRTVYYRNPYACSGFVQCPYRSICLDYQPGIELINFTTKKRRNINED
jgi:hypothetical protein